MRYRGFWGLWGLFSVSLQRICFELLSLSLSLFLHLSVSLALSLGQTCFHTAAAIFPRCRIFHCSRVSAHTRTLLSFSLSCVSINMCKHVCVCVCVCVYVCVSVYVKRV